MRCATAILIMMILLTGLFGCGGGGDEDGGAAIIGDPAPHAPNPVGLDFRPVDLGALAPPDGVDYRTPAFRVHYGLAAISADKAYERGYFGQGVTIAIADDGMDPTHPELAERIKAPRHVMNRNDGIFEIDYGAAGTGHGTYVAMIAAGARGNDSRQGSEIKVAGGATLPQASNIKRWDWGPHCPQVRSWKELGEKWRVQMQLAGQTGWIGRWEKFSRAALHYLANCSTKIPYSFKEGTRMDSIDSRIDNIETHIQKLNAKVDENRELIYENGGMLKTILTILDKENMHVP